MARMLDRDALRLLRSIGTSMEQWMLDKAVTASSLSEDQLIGRQEILEALQLFAEAGAREVSSTFIEQETKRSPTLRAG